MIFMLFILLVILITHKHIEIKSLVAIVDYFVICADKTAAVDESLDAGAEMTEEEWNLRVAELNKHQVCLCYLKTPVNKKKYVMCSSARKL